MADKDRRSKIVEMAPWIITLVLLGALTLVLARSRSTETDVFSNLVKQREIIAGMRTNLLESINAEKNALLADGESESKTFADQARAASEAVARARWDLEPLLDATVVSNEKERVGEFDTFWKEFQELQKKILDLDIEGTNIKAIALSSNQGQAAVKRFEENIVKLVQANATIGRCGEVSKLASDALVALMKIQYLHTPHIHELADEKMDQIEKTMRVQDAIVQDALAALGAIIDPASRKLLDQTTQVYVDFAAVTDDVIKLSRTNTNVQSLELAMGRERLVAAKCNEILSTLQESLRTRGFKATR
jgi:hypothetical protein